MCELPELRKLKRTLRPGQRGLRLAASSVRISCFNQLALHGEYLPRHFEDDFTFCGQHNSRCGLVKEADFEQRL
jgi:hypothetical protein